MNELAGPDGEKFVICRSINRCIFAIVLAIMVIFITGQFVGYFSIFFSFLFLRPIRSMLSDSVEITYLDKSHVDIKYKNQEFNNLELHSVYTDLQVIDIKLTSLQEETLSLGFFDITRDYIVIRKFYSKGWGKFLDSVQRNIVGGKFRMRRIINFIYP